MYIFGIWLTNWDNCGAAMPVVMKPSSSIKPEARRSSKTFQCKRDSSMTKLYNSQRPSYTSLDLWALLTDWRLPLAWILPVTWHDPTSTDLEGVLQCGVNNFWNRRPDFTLAQHCYYWIEFAIWGSAGSCLEQSAKGCSPWHFFL